MSTTGPLGFLTGGAAYVQFALSHPGYFEVMYRPRLYRVDDPELVAARSAAFAVLDISAAGLAAEWGHRRRRRPHRHGLVALPRARHTLARRQPQ